MGETSENSSFDLSDAHCVWLANKRPAVVYRDRFSGEFSEPVKMPKMNGHVNGNHKVNGFKQNGNNGHHSIDRIFVKYMNDGDWFEYDSSKVKLVYKKIMIHILIISL